MQSLHSLKNSIHSAENLQSIVKTMKAHASTSITQFQNAAEASMEYRQVLDMALYIALSKDEEKISPPDPKEGKTIHMIFGSDHGLAGRFNERIVAYALDHVPNEKDHIVIVIGQQVLSRLENDLEISDFFQVPQTQDGITPMVQRLLFKIDNLRDESALRKVILYYNKPIESKAFKEEKEVLFPLDLNKLAQKSEDWDSKSIPTYLMSRDQLLSSLIQQYFFITLYRAFCYSLASENASRLASMESAEKNIDQRLDELDSQYRRERQNSITEELNDVISGFKAIRKSKGNQET